MLELRDEHLRAAGSLPGWVIRGLSFSVILVGCTHISSGIGVIRQEQERV
jgi:hypothetical protein